jgi:hypothetical protein
MVISKGAELILIKHAFISMEIYRSSMYALCINTNKYIQTGTVHVLYLVKKEQFRCIIYLYFNNPDYACICLYLSVQEIISRSGRP